MSGFFKWFKSGAKMKRWMLIILIGIVLACYGLAEILVLKEISFLEVGKVVLTFVVGFTLVIVGIIFSQKRVLEMLVESTDSRLAADEKNVNVKTLIFNKKVYDEGPNIVVIGGGNGLNTVLKGLKEYTNNLTAIVTVSDYGSKPEYSREQLHSLPTGDIKDSLIALSNEEITMSYLLNHKFENEKLKNLSFSDIYLLAMKEITNDFGASVEHCKDILNMTGTVLPVTLDEFKICAELNDGTVVEERDKIPEVVYDKIAKINRIYISPSNCSVAPGVLEAITNADAIIIGPGSLYTNVIPNLLIKNVAKTIKESNAIKIYISNIMTEPGQTDNYSLSEHLKTIFEHVGEGVIDYCIYDTGEIVPEFVRRYIEKGSDLVEIDVQNSRATGVKLIAKNFSYIIDDSIRHNPQAVAQSVIELICDDMKFKDKQNDPEFVLLNSRLKEQKKNVKKEKKENRKNENANVEKKEKPSFKSRFKKTSKFQNKYKDRIISIKTSADKQETNRKRKELLEEKKQTKNMISAEKLAKKKPLITEKVEETASKIENNIEKGTRVEKVIKKEKKIEPKRLIKTEEKAPKKEKKAKKPTSKHAK